MEPELTTGPPMHIVMDDTSLLAASLPNKAASAAKGLHQVSVNWLHR